MSNLLLIKYAEKSVLPAGKYKGQLVSTIIKTNPSNLRYLYYAFDKISFTDSVLAALGIVGDFVIKKPGKNLDIHHNFNKIQLDKKTPLEKFIHFKRKKKWGKTQSKLMMARHINDQRSVYGKKSLQRMNSGNTGLQLNYREK